MTLQAIKQQIPEYAKDIKLNLSKLLGGDEVEGLAINQVYSIALAAAYATKNQDLITAITAEVSTKLSDEEINAAKAGASIMAMNNVYYRFLHLVTDKDYGKMPANLRMNVLADPGIDKVTFELINLAVSAINACGMCIDAHVHQVVKAGISKQGVQSSIRIAAVVNAAAQVLTIG